MLRPFRPAHLVRSGGTTWLVDESWPVAAAYAEDELVALQAWPWPDRGVDPEVARVVVADGTGIVVQDGGQVAWVRGDGVTIARPGGDLTLMAADPDVAWLADNSVVDPGEPPAPPPPMPAGRIVALRRDGASTQVTTPAPVFAIGVRDADVWVTTAEPPVAHPGGPGSWSFEYPSSVLRVTRDRLLAGGLAGAAPAVGEVPATGRRRPYAWTWLEDDPQLVLRHGVPAHGLVWWAGAPHTGNRIDRRVVVVAHDPASGRPSLRVDLGLGLVRDLQEIAGELWLIVARRRFLAVPRDRGVDVLAVSSSGAVRTVYSADAVDISRFAPALHRPSDEEIQQHVDNVRHMFDDLDRFWHSPGGATSPLSDGLTDPSVTVDGEWPGARVVVTLRHPRRPGLVLRRTLRLFDDAGAPIDHEHAEILLMEDLDTGYLAPADEAVDGVLDS